MLGVRQTHRSSSFDRKQLPMKGPTRLHIDRIACDGRGLCAELLPELITLDDWGYPIIDKGPVPQHLEELARDTVDVCPKLALRLVRTTTKSQSG